MGELGFDDELVDEYVGRLGEARRALEDGDLGLYCEASQLAGALRARMTPRERELARAELRKVRAC